MCSYQVPGVCTEQQLLLLYEKDDAVRIEPRPPFPSTCHLCTRSSRALFRPHASGDGTRMRSVLDKSTASWRLCINSRAGSNSGSQQHQPYEELVDNSGRWLTRPPHRPPPMPHRESWLKAIRMSACTRSLQSVYAAAELVCRGGVVVHLCHEYRCCCRTIYTSSGNISYEVYVVGPIWTSVCDSSIDHSEAGNDQGRRVKLELKTYLMKLLRFKSHKAVCCV